MENQPLGIESLLFRGTRIFALGGAILGLIGLLLVVITLIGSGDDSHVALKDLNTTANGDSVPAASVSSGKQLVAPENVKKYLSGDNERILNGWLSNLPKHEQQQDFLDNLSEVITDAEHDKVNMDNAINNYKTVKLSKLSKSGIEEYEEIGKKIALYTTIFGLIIFIALMSLVLVMLAIERNTRVRTQQ